MHITQTAILILAFCAGLHAEDSPRFTIDTGLLQADSVITLRFAKATVAADQVGQPLAADWMKITPPLRGVWTWTSQNSAQFLLTQIPTLGFTYTMELASDHLHLDDTAISMETKLEAATPAFVVQQHYHLREYENPDANARQGHAVYLVFNDDVTAAEVEKFALFTDDVQVKIPVTVRQAVQKDLRRNSYYWGPSWSQRYPKSVTPPPQVEALDETPVKNGLVVTPLEPLPVGKNWRLELLRGIPNAGRTAQMVSSVTHPLGDVLTQKVVEVRTWIVPDQPPQIQITFAKLLAKEGDFSALVSITPTVPDLKFKSYSQNLTITGSFDPNGKYDVEIRPGIMPSRDPWGQVTGSQHHVEFHPLEPILALPSEEASQLAEGQRKYQLEAVNMDRVRVRLKSLRGVEAVRAFQAYANYSANQPKDRTEPFEQGPLPFNLITGKALLDKTYELALKPNSSGRINLDWNEVLGAQVPATLFLSAEGTNGKSLNQESGKKVAQTLIQLTDIGLAWKLTPDEAFLYAFSCETGHPLPNTKLTIYASDANELESRTTDASGTARLPRGSGAQLLLAVHGVDQSILAFDKSLSTLPMWNFPIDFSYVPSTKYRKEALMFTDRGLYRPGETVHLKGVVRRSLDADLQFITEEQAEFVVIDSEGREVMRQAVGFSAEGSFDEVITLPRTQVGEFRAKLIFANRDEAANQDAISDEEDYEERWNREPKDEQEFTARFRVEEFRKNTFEIIMPTPASAVGAEEISFPIAARYFMGQQLSDANLQWFATVNGGGMYPDKYRDFLFGDHQAYDAGYWQYYFGYRSGHDDLGDGVVDRDSHALNAMQKLGSDGTAQVRVPLTGASFSSPRRVTLRAEVTDVNQQTLTQTTSVTVHPAELYLGLSRTDSLLQAGEPVSLNCVAVDTHGEAWPEAVTAQLSVELESWQTVSVKTVGGVLKTLNQNEKAIVHETTLSLEANELGAKTSFQFTPQTSGKHTVTVRTRDRAGHETATRMSLYVYGSDDYAWRYEEGARIKLVPEKRRYKADETARVLVMTPIEGEALVTLERGKVLRHFVTKLSVSQPVLEIPLMDGDAPNVFVSVTLIKGAVENQRKNRQPVVKLGYCTLEVENRQNHLEVTLQPREPEVRPASEAVIDGLVRDWQGQVVKDAEVTLWAVDEGVLSVMGYETPQALEAFHHLLPLRVRAGNSLRFFLSEDQGERYFFNKGFVVGDGGGETNDHPDVLRKDFNPLAYWNARLRTDEQGRFTTILTTPDSLTRYRLMAVVLSGARRMGTGEGALVVNKPLMIEPVVPRFANVNDQLTPKAVIHNTSKYEGTFVVSLEMSAEASFRDPALATQRRHLQEVVLKAGETKAVTFAVSFTQLGEAVWHWEAHAQSSAPEQAGLKDSVESRFPVIYPAPLVHEVHFVNLTSDAGEVDLLRGFTPEMTAHASSIEIEVSRSRLSETGEALEYLLHYPYGCVEQTSSSTIPWILALEMRSHFPRMKHSEAEIRRNLQAGVDRLLSMQTKEGGLAYWPGNKDPQIWCTMRGGMVLLSAREHGATVPEQAVAAMAKWMSEALRRDNDHEQGWGPGWTQDRAGALYLLALAGQSEPAYVEKLLAKRETLAASSRAFLALTVLAGKGAPEVAKTLLEQEDVKSAPSPTSGWNWLSDQYVTSLQLIGWVRLAPQSETTMLRLASLLAQRGAGGHWGDTFSNSWALEALATYAREVETAEAATVEMLGAIHETIQLSRERAAVFYDLKCTGEAAGRYLAKLTAGKQVWLQVRLTSQPAIESLPAVDSGLSITRQYHRWTLQGKAEPLGEPRVGDLVLVSLDVHLPRDVNYIVVDDPLPSTFEAVNQAFASQGSAVPPPVGVTYGRWNFSHEELRDDRALFFNDRADAGHYQLQYLARVTGVGEATAPQARIEAMYEPQKNGLSPSRRIRTQPRDVPAATAGR